MLPIGNMSVTQTRRALPRPMMYRLVPRSTVAWDSHISNWLSISSQVFVPTRYKPNASVRHPTSMYLQHVNVGVDSFTFITDGQQTDGCNLLTWHYLNQVANAFSLSWMAKFWWHILGDFTPPLLDVIGKWLAYLVDKFSQSDKTDST